VAVGRLKMYIVVIIAASCFVVTAGLSLVWIRYRHRAAPGYVAMN
jgi:hypothetical protein